MSNLEFLESIKIRSLEAVNLALHQERVNQTFENYFPNQKPIELNELVNPSHFNSDIIYKCRIIYSDSKIEISYDSYQEKEIKKVKLIEIGDYTYQYKFSNRDFFTSIQSKHPDFSDFILLKNGKVTDSTYANLIFFDGKDWLTPNTPLLNGTKRKQLLESKLIREINLSLDNLQLFQGFSMINSMLPIVDREFRIYRMNLIEA